MTNQLNINYNCVIVEIRAASGGKEANIFAGELASIYFKYANLKQWKTQLIDQNSDSHISFTISGQNVYQILKHESGIHRVQRVPITEKKAKMHTSCVALTIIPDLDSNFNQSTLFQAKDLKISTYRASGAGGQSVNTTDSAVRIIHLPTQIVVTSQAGRSQLDNKVLALKVLNAKLYDLKLKTNQSQKSAFRLDVNNIVRSEKIRTYHWPRQTLTDHRLNKTYHLKQILSGKLDQVLSDLINAFNHKPNH